MLYLWLLSLLSIIHENKWEVEVKDLWQEAEIMPPSAGYSDLSVQQWVVFVA